VKALLIIWILATIGQPIQKRQDSPNPQKNEEIGEQASPPTPSPVPRENGQSKPNENKGAPESETHNWHEAFAPPTWSNWALVLIGVVAIIAAWRTLGTLNKQTADTKTAADAALLNAQAVINSERAWIDVIGMANPEPGWTKKLGVHFFRVQNKGRTPAQFISGTLDHVFVDTPNDLPVSPNYKSSFNSPNEMFITAGTYFDTSPHFNPRAIIEQRPISEKNVKPDQILLFYGQIIYEDVFGQKAHETRWCYAWFDDVRGFVKTGPDGDRDKEYNRHT
jgi:hypothetical protein